MKAGKHHQYTIRSVPPEVDRVLRERAKREGKSLNDVALEALSRAAGTGNGEVIYRDVSDIAGSMKDDDFDWDGFLNEIRQVHPEDWA